MEELNNTPSPTKKSHKGIYITLGTIFVIAIIATIFLNTGILTRKANLNDIYIDLSPEFSMNMEYKINPNVNINKLELKFSFYDKNNKLLTSKTKYVGSVKKNNTYSVTINLFEFSFAQILTIDKVRAEISSGTVPLF